MNLGDVMDEIGDALDTIPRLHVHRYPPDSVAVPAAVITYPDTITYDETYQRGMDRYPDLKIVVMVGKVAARSTRDRIAVYANGTGDKSVKTVVETHSYTACDSVRVSGARFDVVAMNRIEYIAVTFDTDVIGEGAA